MYFIKLFEYMFNYIKIIKNSVNKNNAFSYFVDDQLLLEKSCDL